MTQDKARSIGLPTPYVTPSTMCASDGNRHAQPDALKKRGFKAAQMIQRPDPPSRMAGGVSMRLSSKKPTTGSRVMSSSIRGSELSQTQLQFHLVSRPQGSHQLSNAHQRAPPNLISPTSGRCGKDLQHGLSPETSSQCRHSCESFPEGTRSKRY